MLENFKIFILFLLAKILVIFNYKINGFKIKFPFFHYGLVYYFLNKNYGKPIHNITKDLEILIIDIGANVGDSLALMSNGRNEIHSYEGSQKYFKYLDINANYLKLKGIKNIKVFNKIVSNQFNNIKNTFNSGFPVKLNKSSCNMIDYKIYDNKKVSLIKIDTDGFDYDVINTMIKIISRDYPYIFFEADIDKNNNANDYINSVNNLYKIGYDDFIIFSNSGDLLLRTDKNKLIEILKNFDVTNYTTEGTSIRYFDVLAINKNNNLNYLIERNLFA